MEASLANWWEYSGPDCAKRALAAIEVINQAQIGLHHDNLRHMRMYENREYFTTAISNYMIKAYSRQRRYSYNLRNASISLNCVAPVIDTLTSKIGKERVRPQYLSSGGVIERQRQCEDLNDWLFGMFWNSGLYQWNKKVFRSACIFGKSGIKTYIGKDKHGKYCVKSEPVFMPEIIVDPFDAYYGNPMCIYQQKFITKDSLLGNADYQSKQAQNAIRNATLVSNTLESSAHNTIVVWEAWRRATIDEKGKHVIFTDAGILFEETYEEDEFSIDFFEYKQSAVGFYGLGVCEELMAIQVEINRIVNHIRDALVLCSNPRVYVQGAANQLKNMSNKIGGIYAYPAGANPPMVVAPPVVSPDTWRQLDKLWDRAFEIAGMSQLTASGRNTLGASASGEAIRQYVDVESDRFAELQQNWEDFHVRVAKRYHKTARKIVELQGEYKIQTYDQDRGVWSIDFKDIDVPDDDPMVQCFPSSALPKMPGARLATVKEWRDEGYIDGDQARDLQQIPDIKNKMSYITAPTKVIEQMLEKMALQPKPKSGKWLSFVPEPYMRLDYAVTMGNQMYNFLLLKLPEETDDEREDKLARLELIREWIDRASEMLAQAQPQQAPMAAPGGEQLAVGARGMAPQAISADMAMS